MCAACRACCASWHKDSPGVLGLLHFVPAAVPRHRHRQRLDLPHDPGDLPERRWIAPMPEADASRRAAARRRRKPRRHRLHLGDRRLRRLLHPEELRHLDRPDRRPEAALYVFIVFYIACIAVTWGSTRARAACCTTIERARSTDPCNRTSVSRLNQRQRAHEPFSRPTDLLPQAPERLLRRPRRRHQRRPHLGGRLSQSLGARQDRALHPRRELHRLVLLEDLRQGRHRHLGDPADRLPAHALGHAQPRAARLLARRQLQLVSLQRQPGEVPDGPRRPAEALARGARARWPRSRPGPRSSRTRTSARPTGRARPWAASCARAGTRSTRSSPPPTSTRSRRTAPTASSASRRSRPCRWSATPPARATCP